METKKGNWKRNLYFPTTSEPLKRKLNLERFALLVSVYKTIIFFKLISNIAVKKNQT